MSISGYTTVRNVVSLDYPLREVVKSLEQFCSEICVVDSSDTEDGTAELLQQLKNESRVPFKVQKLYLDWLSPNHGVFDGYTKTVARKMCTGDFCWQSDSDEIVHEKFFDKISGLTEYVSSQAPILILPVIEYWGYRGKVRLDVPPWKPRLSLNHPQITHDIPATHRKYQDYLLYASPGTDGCDYVMAKSFKPIQGSLPPTETAKALIAAMKTGVGYKEICDSWFVDTPGVHHYSWWSIYRKLQHYRSFWASFWQSLYGEAKNPTDNPIFPGRVLHTVTDEELMEYALKLEEGTSGWVFHKPWDGTRVPGTTSSTTHPQVIQSWIKLHTK
jgi:hypothetical protein